MVVATAAAVLMVVWAAWGLARAPEPADPEPASTGSVAAAPPPAAVSDPPSGAEQAGVATPTGGVPPRPAPEPSLVVTPGSQPPDAPTPPRSPAPGRERRGPPPPKPPNPPAPQPADVTATYSVSQVWEDGFQSSISLENTSREPRTVVLSLTFPGGVTLPETPDCWWDVTCTQLGNTITLTTTTPLEPGTRRFVGFNAERRAGPAPFDPVACTVNGSPCDGF